MIRAFIALSLPENLRSQLAVTQYLLPGGRPVAPECFHVTLAFLGEQPEDRLADVDAALSLISVPAFTLELGALGVFGGDKPRSVHAALASEPLLERLQAKVVRAVADCGVRLSHRRFTPHVTLRRYAPGEGSAAALAHAIGAIPPTLPPPRFAVDHFSLMRSRLRPQGPAYDELARYPLRG